MTTPEDVQAFYTGSNTHKKNIAAWSGWMANKVFAHGVGFLPSEPWRAFRKCIDPFFSNGTAIKELPRISQSARDFVSQLSSSDDTALKGGVGGVVVTAPVAFAPFPLLETAKLFFGEMTPTEATEFLEISKTFGKVFRALLMTGLFRSKFLYWVHTPYEYWITIRYLRQFEKFAMTLSQDRAAQSDVPITQLWKCVEEGLITRSQVREF